MAGGFQYDGRVRDGFVPGRFSRGDDRDAVVLGAASVA